MHRDQTLGNTGGDNNKDAMLDWRSGCYSEDKCNCHIHMTCIMIATCFCTNREHYRPIFAICFVAFVCILYQVILYQVIFACCAGMFVWL